MGTEISQNSPPHFEEKVEATMREDGFYVDPNLRALAVSASDLERFTYCPLSWSLARGGFSGQGKEIQQGIVSHREIHEDMLQFQQEKFKSKRNLLIWQWWYAVVLMLALDTVLFIQLESTQPEQILEFSKILALWGLSTFIVGLVALYLPWRKFVGLELPFKEQDENVITPVLEPKGFVGGWFEGGRIEVSLFFAAIGLSLHSMVLQFAQNREQAIFVFSFVTVGWIMLATYRLHSVLIAQQKIEMLALEHNLTQDTTIAYTDGDEHSSLLVDEITGIRGRPDQIVIIDGNFIPVEQKTGKVPKQPYDSHIMQLLAYVHLVECTTRTTPAYGLLRYGTDDIHQIHWTNESKQQLFERVKEVQQAMVEGNVHRNHERKGKCQHCSRRYACEESLV